MYSGSFVTANLSLSIKPGKGNLWPIQIDNFLPPIWINAGLEYTLPVASEIERGNVLAIRLGKNNLWTPQIDIPYVPIWVNYGFEIPYYTTDSVDGSLALLPRFSKDNMLDAILIEDAAPTVVAGREYPRVRPMFFPIARPA